MASQSTICGVDLGTTNSLVAYVGPAGRPVSIANFTGDVLTPSMVFIEGNSCVVGEQAKRAGQDAPDQFAECFKRFMGEDWYPELIGGNKYRPEVLSSLVLKRLKMEAQRHLGRSTTAVVTVPAYFDECRRRATKNACAIARWEVVDLINEPTAAAIAYAHRQDQGERRGVSATCVQARERIMVYDLGGGTFDTTVLEIAHVREYRTLATEGEVRLGGQDWDEWLRQYLADQFKAKTAVDPLASPRGAFEFLQMARSTKHFLTMRKSVSTPAIFQGRRALLEVSLDAFEKGTAPLLRRSRETSEMVLEQAKLRWKEIDAVLMIGGSTRMPMVAKMLRSLTGKEPRSDVSADEAVAHGAAVYAHLLGQPGSPKVINVNSHTYRLGCMRHGKSHAHPLIPKNSPLPMENAMTIPVTHAGIDNIRVKIFEGESDDPNLCYPIGRVKIGGLAKDPTKRWLVSLSLRCLEDGKISVGAAVKDPSQPDRILKKAEATLDPQHGMSAEEVLQARRFVDSLGMG